MSVISNDKAAYEGSMAVLELITQTLLTKYPQYFSQNYSRFHSKLTGETIDLQNLPIDRAPPDIATQMVHEDFVLMHQYEPNGPYHFSAASFSFPSAWSPASKLGKAMQEVHAPVQFQNFDAKNDSLNAHIGDAIDITLSYLNVHRPLWRMNMIITQSPNLFKSLDVPESIQILDYPNPMTISNAGDRLWLRLEYQAFIRVQKTNDLIFSVRTFIYLFKSIPPNVAKHIKKILLTPDKKTGIKMTDFLLSKYKGWTPEALGILLQYLDKLAS